MPGCTTYARERAVDSFAINLAGPKSHSLYELGRRWAMAQIPFGLEEGSEEEGDDSCVKGIAHE
jgi:hypothetical protein